MLSGSRFLISGLYSRVCPSFQRCLASSAKFTKRKHVAHRSIVTEEEADQARSTSESYDQQRRPRTSTDGPRSSTEQFDRPRRSNKSFNRPRFPSIEESFDPSMDPSTVSVAQLESFILRRQFLIVQQIDAAKPQAQYSKDFMDFLISWCKVRCEDVTHDRLDPIRVACLMAKVLHSMKLTLKELGKKKKPRETALVEMSRLYRHGLEKLAEDSEDVEKQPIMFHRLLCQYADVCCNFDFDPSTSEVDVWPLWFRVAQFFLEGVDSEATWKEDGVVKKNSKQDFNEAYAYLLSIIIDVTLRFRRAYEFGTVKFAWESRLADHVENFKERNSYILSLRMAELAQKHGLEFDHLVAKHLMIRGIQRSFGEYQFRKGLAEKPSRSTKEAMKEDSSDS